MNVKMMDMIIKILDTHPINSQKFLLWMELLSYNQSNMSQSEHVTTRVLDHKTNRLNFVTFIIPSENILKCNNFVTQFSTT